MNKCEKCGFLHYRTDPCRKPKVSVRRDALGTGESQNENPLRPRLRTGADGTISTAARKDVPVFSPHHKRPSQGRVSEPAEKAGGESVAPTEALRSRNQALPVDTNSPHMATEQPQAHGSSPCMDQGKIGGPQPTVQLVTAGETAPNRKRGRPRIWPDRKTAKAHYERQRRARMKEGK